MIIRKQNSFVLKTIILTLPIAFLLFSAPKSNNNLHPQLKIIHQADSCCKNCGNENCSCCANHIMNDSNNSDDCSCQVSKDMDDKPLSLPGNSKLAGYCFFQIKINFPNESISKHLSLSRLNYSNEYYNTFKAETDTVIRI